MKGRFSPSSETSSMCSLKRQDLPLSEHHQFAGEATGGLGGLNNPLGIGPAFGALG